MKTSTQWHEDHYPVEADQLVCAPDPECLAHSIAKWEGLREDNLPPSWSYYDWKLKRLPLARLEIDISSCALCQKYSYIKCKNTDGESCPIVRTTGASCASAYEQSRHDPEPMIALLKSTLESISNPGAPQ